MLSPRFEDDRIAIYTTTPQVDLDFDLLFEPVDGLNQVAVSLPSSCWIPGQVIGLNAAWANSKPLDARYEVLITLVNSDGTSQQELQFPLTDLEPNETWPTNTIGQGYYPFPLDTNLTSGQYDLQMQLIRIPQGSPESDTWSIGEVTIRSTPCELPVSENAIDVNATFGIELILQDMIIEQYNDHLAINMSWLSLKEMVENYKIFVHLIESDTGMLVAQNDTIPVNWQYPTSLWWSGIWVEDTISLDLEGVSEGRYLLSIGVYAESTGERLEVVNADGSMSMERSLLIPYPIQVGNYHALN